MQTRLEGYLWTLVGYVIWVTVVTLLVNKPIHKKGNILIILSIFKNIWLVSKEIGEPSGNKGVDWAAQWSVQPTKMYSVHHCCTRSPEHQSTAEHQSTTTDQSRWREGCIVIERTQLKWPRPTYSWAQPTVLHLHILYCHRKSQKLGEHKLLSQLGSFHLKCMTFLGRCVSNLHACKLHIVHRKGLKE